MHLLHLNYLQVYSFFNIPNTGGSAFCLAALFGVYYYFIKH